MPKKKINSNLKINSWVAGLAVFVVASIGGFLVYQSFASTGTTVRIHADGTITDEQENTTKANTVKSSGAKGEFINDGGNLIYSNSEDDNPQFDIDNNHPSTKVSTKSDSQYQAKICVRAKNVGDTDPEIEVGYKTGNLANKIKLSGFSGSFKDDYSTECKETPGFDVSSFTLDRLTVTKGSVYVEWYEMSLFTNGQD